MKAIFLDRDGVINKYPGDTKYVTSVEEFKFLPRVKQALALLNKKRYTIFIISNQAGVGRGIYSHSALENITSNMLKELTDAGVKISGVFYCTHRKEDNCPCRKPKIGLLESAAKGKDVDIKSSFFIGDSILDVETAKAAGCKSILVFSGKEKLLNRKNWKIYPDFTCKDIYAAAMYIVAKTKGVG